jgi:hypothetical protein
MKWVALAIVVSLGLYTFLTLYFRKSSPGYRPYQDSRDRATVTRLLSAGYQRIPATVERPADLQRASAPTASMETRLGGLPSELNETLVDKPALPDAFSNVIAPNEANALLPYSIQFTCTLPDYKRSASDTYVYRKGDELAIVANFEHLDGELLARSKELTLRVTLPGGSLSPGTYHVTLVGARESKHWTLQVH